MRILTASTWPLGMLAFAVLPQRPCLRNPTFMRLFQPMPELRNQQPASPAIWLETSRKSCLTVPSQFTEPWEIIINCFESLRFGVVCYANHDNGNRTFYSESQIMSFICSKPSSVFSLCQSKSQSVYYGLQDTAWCSLHLFLPSPWLLGSSPTAFFLATS